MNDRPPKKPVKVFEIDVDPVTLLAIAIAMLLVPFLLVGFMN
jgi:hypothetical protein